MNNSIGAALSQHWSGSTITLKPAGTAAGIEAFEREHSLRSDELSK
jgi:hypothetical protein